MVENGETASLGSHLSLGSYDIVQCLKGKTHDLLDVTPFVEPPSEFLYRNNTDRELWGPYKETISSHGKRQARCSVHLETLIKLSRS